MENNVSCYPSIKCQEGKHSDTISSFQIHCYSAQRPFAAPERDGFAQEPLSPSLPFYMKLCTMASHPPILCIVQGQKHLLLFSVLPLHSTASAPLWYLMSGFELEKMCLYPAFFNEFILTIAGNHVGSQSQHTKGWL